MGEVAVIMNVRSQIFKYILLDVLGAWISWIVLYTFRKVYWEHTRVQDVWRVGSEDPNFVYGLIAIPIFWVIIYFLLGHYRDVFRRHRLKEFTDVFIATFLGTLVLFFFILLDDVLPDYRAYYSSFSILFGCHFVATLTLRLLVTSFTVKRMKNGEWGFPTLLVGGNAKALSLYEEIHTSNNLSGYRFVGFVRINGKDNLLEKHIPLLGQIEAIPAMIQAHNVREVIIAVESSDHKHLQEVLNQLLDFDVDISIIPDTFDLLSGGVKMTGIYGVPLVRIRRELMPAWQMSVKRLMDVVLSLIAIFILSPIYIAIAIAVRFSSEGPVFYSQERIGIHGKPFHILKFRTMYVNSEINGPQLSSNDDTRITKVGKFLRKTRLDEIPQFFHVVIGEMSLVGPRPERSFYIEKIKEQAPHVKKLLRVRPGITSWGQVKYGYAENVGQMIQRLKYDILYLENMSLAMDIKILFYTIVTVLRGSGK
jgi:exopolysaccharide biosynthesis polyprenyl glycosylphosphotransferase